MNPLQNLTNEQFQALKVASDKFCATFAAHRTNPTDFDALNAWDIATSEFMTAVNNDELNIIASLLAALTANKGLITEQQQIIAELKARPVAPLKFSESADADYCREWAWNETKKELNTEHWKTEDNGNFYGFFLTGWHARLQYNEQRRAENLRIYRCRLQPSSLKESGTPVVVNAVAVCRIPSTSESMQMKSVAEWVFSRIWLTVMSNTDIVGSLENHGTSPQET